MKKPFVPDELDAHLRAILRMKEGKKNRNEKDIYKFGHYTLNAKHATLLDNERNKQITLTVREAQILQVLAENKGEVVRRDAILSRFWNREDDYFASRSLDVFITKLRKLFVENEQIKITNKRGIGFMLEVKE